MTTPTENVVAELRGRSAYPGDVNDQAAALIESQRATIERVERERDEADAEIGVTESLVADERRLRFAAEARVAALEAEKAGLVAALEDLAIHVSMGWETDDVMLAARAALSRSTEKNDD